MRNLYAVMDKFQTLPSDDSFKNLSNGQLELILHSMEIQNKEIELARKGLTSEGNYYDDGFDEEVWNKEEGEWDILREGHNPDDIYKQVTELTKEEDLKNLYSKFDSAEEYEKFREQGGKTTRETEVEGYIDRRIREAQEKAKLVEASRKKRKGLVDDRDLDGVQDKSENTSMGELDKKAIEDSIKLFEQDDDDDDFTML